MLKLNEIDVILLRLFITSFFQLLKETMPMPIMPILCAPPPPPTSHNGDVVYSTI